MREATREWQILAGVLVATSIVLLPKFWNGFVYDDLFVFVANDVIHDPANIPSLFTHNAIWVTGRVDPMAIDTYRPLTLATFALDSLWTGRSPFGYHLINLFLHLLCVVLVYATGRAAMRPENRSLAWIAAAWFGVSPWLGEAHLWINGRSDPLCALFVLSAILVWDRALRNHRWTLHALAGVLMFAALLCKEVALGIFPSLLLWPTLSERHPTMVRRVSSVSALALGAVAYLAVRVSVLGGVKSFQDRSHLLESMGNYGLLFFDGLRAALIPSPPYLRSMVESYVTVPSFVRWAALVGALAVIGLSFVVRRRHAALCWSIFLFAGTLAPAALITTLIWPGFGRYLYLPVAALCIGVVDALATELRSAGALSKPFTKRVVGVAVALYLIGSALLLHRFAYDFRDDGSLYGSAVRNAPDQAYGHAYLGLSLVNHGHPDEAVDYARTAVRIQPAEPKYRFFLGQALIRSDRSDEAVALAEQWLQDGRPIDAPQYLLIVVDALENTDPRGATAAALACLRANPAWVSCLERLRVLTDAHPRALEVRAAVREQLAHPQNREIAPIVEPMLTKSAN